MTTGPPGVKSRRFSFGADQVAYRIVVRKGVAKLVRNRRKYRPLPYPVKLAPHFPGLKMALEAIWRDTKVRCPSHITLWNHNYGYVETLSYTALRFWDWNATGRLYYAKGRKRPMGDAVRKRLMRRIRSTGA